MTLLRNMTPDITKCIKSVTAIICYLYFWMSWYMPPKMGNNIILIFICFDAVLRIRKMYIKLLLALRSLI